MKEYLNGVANVVIRKHNAVNKRSALKVFCKSLGGTSESDLPCIGWSRYADTSNRHDGGIDHNILQQKFPNVWSKATLTLFRKNGTSIFYPDHESDSSWSG